MRSADPSKMQIQSASDALRLISTRHVYAALLFVGTLVACAIVFDENPDLNGDNTNYLMLGKALSEGQGYTNTDFIKPVPATNFPPGYPVLVAVVVTFFSDEITTVKMANGLFFALAILLLFYLFRLLSGNDHLAFAACVCAALNSHLLRFSTMMMSEIPFLLFTTATLVFFLHTGSSTFADLLKKPQFYLFLFCLVFSCYIRTAGLSLLIGVLVVLLLKRDWKYLFTVCGVFVLAMLPWSLRARQLGADAYLSRFIQINPYRPELGLISIGDLVARIFNNASRYVSHEIPGGCLSYLPSDYTRIHSMAGYATGAALLLVMGFGLYHLCRDRDLVFGYFLGTTAILLGWPEVWTDVRFLVPVIPLLLLCLLNGLWMMMHLLCLRYNTRWHPHPLLLLLLALPFISGLADLQRRAATPPPAGWRNYFQMAVWARENLPEHAVICCRKSSLFYLYAQKYVTRYEFIPDTDEFIDHLKRRQVTHVVLDNLGFGSTGRYLVPAVQQNLDMFREVHRLKNPDTMMLEFRPDGNW
jgi:hypothetical protein